MATRKKKVVRRSSSSTAVAKAEPSLPAVPEEVEGATGFENVTQDDLAIPFLNILQSGSPQCKRSDGRYIDGAQEGMIFDTVKKEVYDGDEGLQVVPFNFRGTFVEWIPREEGGGLVGEHDRDSQIVQDMQREMRGQSRYTMDNGHELLDTRNWYVLYRTSDEDEWTPAVVSMSSTNLSVSKKWMSFAQMRTPRLWRAVYHLTTVPRSNDKGNWYGWDFSLSSLLEETDDVTLQAAALHKSSASGQLRESYDSLNEEIKKGDNDDDDDVDF